MKYTLTITVALASFVAIAQPEMNSVVIGAMTTRPNALLVVNPKNSNQGVLLPQLSTGQRISMRPSSPAEDGLIVFDRNMKAYYYWINGRWVQIKTSDSGNTVYQSIDPASFRELKTDSDIRHNNMVIFESDNSFATASRDGAGETIIAPIGLPHGAIIKEVTVHYMDNHELNMTVRLIRKALAGGTEEIATWESAGISSLVNHASITNFKNMAVIDLANYSYRLTVEFNLSSGEVVDTPAMARQRLYGVRIRYEQ